MAVAALCLHESASVSAVRDGVWNITADVLTPNAISVSCLSVTGLTLFPMCTCLLSNAHGAFFLLHR